MYARVAVASDALDTGSLPLPVANAIHVSFMQDLQAHGRLIFSEDSEVAALLDAIRSGPGLPPDARSRWRETLACLAKNKRIRVLHQAGATPLASVRTLEELRRQWATDADIAVIAVENCSPLGVSLEAGILADPKQAPDVSITAAVPSSPAMTRLKELADRGFAASGSSRETFWRDVLEPLATDALNVNVLDRFLFKVVWDIAAGKPWARGWQSDQLAWLLERLDSCMAPGATVRLIGEAHRDYPRMNAAATAAAVESSWGWSRRGRLGEVAIAVIPSARGRRFPHDRHARFSTGGAILIPAGFDRLRDDAVWDPDGMNWQYRWTAAGLQELAAVEARVTQHVGISAVSSLTL